MNIKNTLTLPCGVVLKNRLAKSAMSENMGTPDHRANKKFGRLYRTWAEGGTGLLITGNIMVDHNALGEPGNVVIEKGRDFSDLKEWASSCKLNDVHLWTQINHPGKQSPKFLSPEPVAPSSLALKPPLDRMFNRPRELKAREIEELIERYTYAALVSKESGFTGVQIHGAHGYLVSQFLSPLHNQRSDDWGGSLDHRMRFVVRIYEEMRKATGPRFPLSIKLNSADFQRGGFTQEESMIVVEKLSSLGMDLIEISGGTYEAPEMTGTRQKKSTREREAYFLDYCEAVRQKVKTPLMLTGGFRSIDGMEKALGSGACDVIGLARSLAIDPDFSQKLMSGQDVVSPVKPLTTGIRSLDHLVPLEVTWYTHQLNRMGNGLKPDAKMSALGSILRTMASVGLKNLRRVRAKN